MMDLNKVRIIGLVSELFFVPTGLNNVIIIKTDRLRGENSDYIPVEIPKYLMKNFIVVGQQIEVLGTYRSCNIKRRLRLFVEAHSISQKKQKHDCQIDLIGTVCKKPVYRTTPRGREITDFFLAVNTPQTSYIPCIAWGRHAHEAYKFNVGTRLHLTGRIQSRNYIKDLGETEQIRTAYEVSVVDMSVE